MSPNSDNAMARFLFAILKQKNLKDIDWNEVASDPVLLQPITNGHAARMRYSRFRSTVTNNQGRTTKSKSADKSRVSKSKPRSGGSVKAEPLVTYVKREFPQQAPISHYSPASTTSPYLSDNRDDFGSRFLTPCSDDVAHGFAVNPAAVENRRHCPPPGFSPPLDFVTPSGIMNSPAFSAFDDAAFEMNNFAEQNHTGNDLHDQHAPDWSNRLQTHFV